MTTASGELLPLAGGAAEVVRARTPRAATPARSRNAAVTAVARPGRQLELVLEHEDAAVGDAELQAAAGRRQRLDEPQGVGRSARAAHADEHALRWSTGHA